MRLLKLLSIIICCVVVICAVSFFTDKRQYNHWKVYATKHDSIPWAKFYWTGDTINGKYFARTAMQIPFRLEGLPNTFTFQFDLGDPITEVYEINAKSLKIKHPELNEKIERLRSTLQFWNTSKAFKNLSLNLGDIIISTDACFIKSNYGEALSIRNDNDTLALGTLGADVFVNKVLIIDYPAQRFALCDSVPLSFATSFVPIEFDSLRRKIVLPMTFKKNHYRVTFDNGSSLFPLITLAKNINLFSTRPDTDTIRISSWGKEHNVVGRLLTDSFELAGQKFANVKVYANYSGLGIDADTNAMAGNALFWNRIVIIDFKNKRFGVK